jgi:hypothetical protein
MLVRSFADKTRGIGLLSDDADDEGDLRLNRGLMVRWFADQPRGIGLLSDDAVGDGKREAAGVMTDP